jgi:S-adenosylmethionine hydrolase
LQTEGEYGTVAIEGLGHSYGTERSDAPFAYIGSAGTLEVAIRGASAADLLTVATGAQVIVVPQGADCSGHDRDL